MKLIKVAHAADIHVRPYKYMDEMIYTFERFFESIKNNNVDLVVLCGDFFHSKLTVSNEYFDVAFNFFNKLLDIAPCVIIPGNHDTALTNHGRMDAVSPVINAIKSSNKKNEIIYSIKSESFSISNFENIIFHHFSIFEKKTQWPSSSTVNPAKINLALYHGSINNCIVDSGWVSRGNEDDISIFNGFDGALLGDIHKSQFMTPTVAYPGSLRQNNFGEDVEKGYILWNIGFDEDGDKVISGKKMPLPQKRYFFTLYASDVEDVNGLDLPKDCRIRVKLTKDIDIATESAIREVIVKQYSPNGEITFLPAEDDLQNIKITKVGNLDLIHENIRDREIQKKLIIEYLKKKEVEQDVIDKVVDMDKKYHSYVDTDVLRDVKYNLKEIKWENLFSYGKSNYIDFEKLNGLVGVFGDNGAGKSSIFDVLLFAFQNSIFREGANKNGDYVNRKCKNADLEVTVEMNGKNYKIERSIKKIYSRTDKNKEPKVDNEVEFYTIPKKKESSLNGETKPDTNKEIKNLFGTKEDFEITSYCPQFNLTSFIDSRATDRKKNLAKFFDLDVFETKYEKASEDLKEIKLKFKDKNKTELAKKKKTAEEDIVKIEQDVAQLRIKKEHIKNNIILLDDKISSVVFLKEKITDINLNDIKNSLTNLLGTLRSQNESHKKFNDVVQSSLKDKTHEQLEVESTWYDDAMVMHQIDKVNSLIKKIELLNKIPNVDACKVCTLAKDAYLAQDCLVEDNKLLEKLKIKNVVGIAAVDYLKNLNSLNEINEKIQKTKNKISEHELKISQYEEEKDTIEQNKKNRQKIEEYKQQKRLLNSEISHIDDEILKLTTQLGSNKAQIVSINQILDAEKEASEKMIVYNHYLDCMGKNGISYWIISKKLILINKLVNQILSHAVNFKFSIEDNEEEKSIKLFIVDDGGKRIAELASGGEKTVISLALRAALWRLSLLPKTPILILDESLSFLDSKRYDAIIKILKYLTEEYFDKIFVITHDEELKKEMDNIIYIDKKDGYSSCKV